jgi:surface protein
VNAQTALDGHSKWLAQTRTINDDGLAACDETVRPFITTWSIAGTNPKVTLLTAGAGYDFEVDWGEDEGYTQRFIGTPAATVTHTYTGTFEAGETRTIKIRGSFPRLFCNNNAICANLFSVDQWGDMSWISFANAFDGATNLTINAKDTPNLTNVTSMTEMFDGATNLTGNFSGWDTSRITNMSYLFRNATNFNQDISLWDTSRVTTMANMFSGASAFNQPLNAWDTSSVTTMASMFNGASAFNQPLDSWKVSKVTTVASMFLNAAAFNQDLSSWNVEKVVAAGFENMLSGANLSIYNYNELLDKWSKQTVIASATKFIVSPAQYGGCEENAQAGIEGHIKLFEPVADGGKNWAITDGGFVLCAGAEKYPECDTADITVGDYTVAACNVGATIAGTGYSLETSGKKFQRGNNYGWKDDEKPTTAEVQPSNPTRPYSSGTFIKCTSYNNNYCG